MIDPRPLHERFDLTYVRRRQWPARWVVPMSVVLALGIGGVLAWMTWRGDQRLYTSGPLTTVHAMFGHDCGQCHQPDPARSGYWLPVTDAACLKCHTATAHHPFAQDAAVQATMNVSDRLGAHPMAQNCTACHSEHRGQNFDLQRVPDPTCVACHGQLHPNVPESESAYNAITAFITGHPNWRTLDGQPVDKTPLRMGHALHMNPNTPKMQEALREWRDALKASMNERDMPIQQVLDDHVEHLFKHRHATACRP